MVSEIYRSKCLALAYGNVLTILILIAIAVVPMFTQDGTPSISVAIDNYGLVYVSITLSLSEGLHKLSLPIEPMIPTINAVCDGETVPVIYDEGHIYLVLDKDATTIISYIANVSIVNSVFYLDIRTSDIVKIEVHEDVILLLWPEENIVDIGLGQEVLILYIKGPTTIRYTLKQQHTVYTPSLPRTTQIPQTPTSTEIQQTIPTSASASMTTTSVAPTYAIDQSKEGLQLHTILVLIIVLGGVGGALYYLFFVKKRKSLGSVMDMLGDVDIAIIKALEVRGGAALQTELQNDVKVPRTTLWRHIRKLEKMGIVKVEKVGLQNKVVLIKKIRFS